MADAVEPVVQRGGIAGIAHAAAAAQAEVVGVRIARGHKESRRICFRAVLRELDNTIQGLSAKVAQEALLEHGALLRCEGQRPPLCAQDVACLPRQK